MTTVVIAQAVDGEILCESCARKAGYKEHEWTVWTVERWEETIDVDDCGKFKAAPSSCQHCGLGDVSRGDE